MQCCICLQEAVDPQKLQCCSNNFCSSCIGQWKLIRNNCPLCGFQIGKQKINNLVNSKNEEFDNGSLMLETQIKQSRQKTKYLKNILKQKRQQSNNLKSNILVKQLFFLQDQMFLVDQYFVFVEESFFRNDRITCINHLQLIAQIILKIQSVLNGEQDIQQQQYDDEYDEQDEYKQSYYDDYEQFGICEKIVNKNYKGKSKSDFKDKHKNKNRIY